MDKTESISEWVDTYKLPLGGIGFCITQMLLVLQRLGNQEAVELGEEVDRKHDRARRLKYHWEQQKDQDPLVSEGARQIDNRIDNTLTLINRGAEVYAQLEGDSRKKRLANELIDSLFPAGVYPITSKSFTEQHDAVVTALEQLDGEFAEHVDALDLGPMVDQLEELNSEFGSRLEADDEQVVYDEVEAAYTEAEEAFSKLLLQVLCDYRDDLETLNQVMAPVHKQTALMRRHMKRRGNAPQVDPETGEPVEPTGEGNSPINDGGSEQDDGQETSGGDSGDAESSDD